MTQTKKRKKDKDYSKRREEREKMTWRKKYKKDVVASPSIGLFLTRTPASLVPRRTHFKSILAIPGTEKLPKIDIMIEQ